MAAALPARQADPRAERDEAPRRRALRQFVRQQVESQSESHGLSRPHDVGRDDGAVFRHPHRQGHRPGERRETREVLERRRRRVTFVLAILLAAQIGGKPVNGGNPTPGTPQPDPPNVAERITATGCVQLAKDAPKVADGNTVMDTRYVLTNAESPAKI